MVRHFLILENSETEFSVDPRNGRRNNTTRSALSLPPHGMTVSSNVATVIVQFTLNYCSCPITAV